MTSVKFSADKGLICGFKISGHCSVDGDDEIGKLICATVSSAAYMTVNTITDVIGDKADITVGDGEMFLHVNSPSDATVKILRGFKLHIEQLCDQYGNNIRIYGGADNVKD